MLPDVLCGLLAEPERLRAYAAVVLGAASPGEVAAATGLPSREVVRALRRLEQGGVLATSGGRIVAVPEVFKQAVREHRPEPEAALPDDPDPGRAAVLRAFIRNGKLLQIPMTRGKRRVVLEHIAACFEPGVRYPERAVDAVLRAWYDDYVSLRRHLIDELLMAREHGSYWRTGGYVEVD